MRHQDEVKACLQTERSDLTQALNAFATANSDELVVEWQRRDSPSEDEIRDAACGRRDWIIRRVRLIDEALDRMRHGRYGKCADCGRAIGKRRLEFDPAARLCVFCQASSEGDQSAPTL